MKINVVLSAAKRLRPRSKASGLLLAMGFVLVVSIVVGMVIRASNQATADVWRTAVVENSLSGSRTVANGLVHNAIFIARSLPPQLDGRIDQLDNLILSMRPQIPEGYQVSRDAQGNELAFFYDLGPNNFVFAPIEDPLDEWFGYSASRLDWDVYAVVREDSNRSDTIGFDGIGLKKRITVDYIPLYQFAIFYETDLELHPGPVMDVRGRVHSNRDLYLSSGDRIDLHERVTSVGHFYRFNHEHGGSAQGGTTNIISEFGGRPNNNRSGGGWIDSLSPNWVDLASERWGRTFRDASFSAPTIRPPLPAGAETYTMIQRARNDDPVEIRDLKFENKADIIILGDPGQPSTIHALIRNHETGQLTPVPSQFVTPGNSNSFVNIGEFYDGQQTTVVRTLDIDMGRLRTSNLVDFTAGNGIVYVSTKPSEVDSRHQTFTMASPDPTWQRDAEGNIVFSATGVPAVVTGQEGWWRPSGDPLFPGSNNFLTAVRVHNAANLPANTSNGFGLYTDRPLYTVGNVNTTNRKTAIMAGDSVTVLSQMLSLQKPTFQTNANGSIRLDANGRPIPNMNSNNTQYVYGTGNTREQGPHVRNHLGNEIAFTRTVPTANNTTTNVIYLMGNTPSVYQYSRNHYTENIRAPGGNPNPRTAGSGGAHNVMRYLENWAGRTHTFNGSMIVLWESQLAVSKNRTSRWVRDRIINNANTGYYDAPNRSYNWDNSLQGSTPPPGMPIFLEPREGPWQRVSYEEAVAAFPRRRYSSR